jgi:hypothetical protein
MRLHRHLTALALPIVALTIRVACAQTSDSLQTLETPSSPQMCAAVRTNGASAADRLNLIASDVAVKIKAAIDASNGQNALRECVSALSSLQQGLDIQLRYPNVSGLLNKIVERACHVVDQDVTSEVQGVRSRFGTPGGYFGLQGAAAPLGVVSVNTQDSSSYAANCVWDWLNSRPTHCR